MCGRYTLSTPADLIGEHFDLPEPPALTARYNIAPSQESLIIGSRKNGERAAGLARWGLVTAPGAGKPRPMINARIETAHRLPSFRDAFERRRCLVPADGFYEWRADVGGKVPCYFSLRGGKPFAFAGIWNRPTDLGAPASYAILTTRPNDIVEHVHARMPVIIGADLTELWLARRPLTAVESERIAEPFPPASMVVWEVSTLVNSPANDTAECIQPVAGS